MMCWIHSLVYRVDCDRCRLWSAWQMTMYGQVFVRRHRLGLRPVEATPVTTDGELFERRNGLTRVVAVR